MSFGWIIVIVLLVFGVVLGNVMLLRYSSRFKIPKDFKSKPPKDKDEDDTW
ncbi:DUF2897 family protein [Alteromonas ponticola]|uniref:DUF2897 family protein n=1 Tax=Alteromonas aquimaris TaxID=2998417 RepID=A0ABT3P7R2_9ALTE|nr:DUF2897 family protein [Alteromonas aquimaris]MCW8108802.1 DUF2897 family protein [Alteromonas aquimaris]